MQSPSLVAKPAHLRSVWLLPGKSSTPTISENPETAVEPFKAVPWGNKDNECITSIAVNGLPPVPVALTGTETYDFAVETRQVFSHLTGAFTDFDNGTTLVDANMTLGVPSEIPISVTFERFVYMDYDDDCRIFRARAIAPQVRSKVLSMLVKTQIFSIRP